MTFAQVGVQRHLGPVENPQQSGPVRAHRLEHVESGQLKVVCTLEWNGTVSAETTAAIEVRKPSLTWQALLLL